MSIVGPLIGSLVSGIFGATNTHLSNEFNSFEAERQRKWSSAEAEEQRKWSSAEAELARDWNEEMNYKYNSIPGKIAQAEMSGVNPLFAVTDNAVSPVSASASAPSGAAASSGAAARANPFDIVDSLLSGAKLKSEIDLIKAQTKKVDAEAEGQLITNEDLKEMNVVDILSKRSQIDYNDENTKLITAKILNTNADTDKKSAELGQIASTIANMDADTEVKRQSISVMFKEIEFMSAQITHLSAQDSEISENIKLLGARFTEVSNNNDFFDKVREYQENIIKAKSDNASIAEKLSALAPILGKVDFPHEYEGPAEESHSKLYDSAYKKYLDTYIDIMIAVAESK